MGSLAVVNIGQLVSGDIEQPLLEADTILIREGKIAAVGNRAEIDLSGVDRILDAKGCLVTPGLMDSQAHPVLGDWTPRLKMWGYLETAVHCGVTTMISAGETHMPGRPRDPAGVKALAILGSRSFRNFRPLGLKIHGGAVILERGLTETDFVEMAQAGVWLLAEIGLGGVNTPEEAMPMVKWARNQGMRIVMHFGGQSMPEGRTTRLDDVVKIEPDIVSHINGGPTAVSLADAEALVRDTNLAFDMVMIGNPKIRMLAIEWCKRYNAFHRVAIGSDMPSGFGWNPYAILRVVVEIASLNDIPPEKALCLATGNTGQIFGLNTGTIRVGKEADIVIMDSCIGSFGRDALEAMRLGDVPGIGAVVIDGEVKVLKGLYTPAPKHVPTIQ
jgi:enamidase